VSEGIVPVAGKSAEQTPVAIWGTGFQPGATVTFDGTATPATLDRYGHWIFTTAPPHPAGAIDVVVIDPDGRASRLEKPFYYVEDLLTSGDITLNPGDSVTATLGRDEPGCGDEGIPCRSILIRAPADAMVTVALESLDGRARVGLYESAPFQTGIEFAKQLTVRGGQQVWVMGEWALFRLTARVAK
jgi:hypothetical protein